MCGVGEKESQRYAGIFCVNVSIRNGAIRADLLCVVLMYSVSCQPLSSVEALQYPGLCHLSILETGSNMRLNFKKSIVQFF